MTADRYQRRRHAVLAFSVTLIGIVVVAAAVFMLVRVPQEATIFTPNTNSTNTSVNASVVTALPTEIQVDTFVSSIPAHGESLTSAPENVVIVFSRPLGPSSSISVTDKDGAALQLGRATFSDDRTTMSAGLSSRSSGTVTVSYTACSTDNTECETGTFGFTILD